MDANKQDPSASSLIPRAVDDRMVCPLCRGKFEERDMRWQINGRAVCVMCDDKIARNALGLR